MTRTREEINIARIVYDEYPHSDLLPIDPEHDCLSLQTLLAKVTGENIGDSLFKFIVVEIVEGGESTLSGAIRVLEQARADVEAVSQALCDYLSEQGRKGSRKAIYKVWIQVEEADERQGYHINIGRPYEAGRFKSRKQAVRFVKNELMPIRPAKLALQEICHLGFQFLDTLPETELTTESENRQGFHKMLKDALNRHAPIVDESCPKCGAGNDERELTEKEFIGIEAIHMHYLCNKCGTKIIEEFKLVDVFIDDQAS